MNMNEHITLLGVLHIAFNALGVLAALIVFVVIAGGGFISGDIEAMAITAAVASSIASFLFIISAPGIIGGIFLLKRKCWARILMLVLGFLELICFPLGTILGIYTLWVLMKEETAEIFEQERQSRPSVPFDAEV